MEKSQREVTDKIRNSIKEKLKEINVFVDDELPDYIMILVANKRSKHHMEKDLTLFLGNETTVFTNWLWDLVNNLKVGSKSNRAKQEILDSKIPETIPELKENRAEEEDVLNYDPTEEGEFYCTEDKDAPASNQPVEVSSSASKIISASESKILVATPGTETNVCSHPIDAEVKSPKDEPLKMLVNKKVVDLPSAVKNTIAPLKTPQKSAKVYPVQRMQEVAVCDLPSKAEFTGNVSSVVCVTQRKYGGPAALQANKLLQKAVNDAAKSVLDGKDINEFYKISSVKDLPTSITETYHMRENKVLCAKTMPVNFGISKDLRTVKGDDCLNSNIEGSARDERNVLPARQVISFKIDEMSEDSATNSPELLPSPLHSVHDQTPHFIVTLDGINLPSLKRRHSSVEPMEIDEVTSVEETLNPAPVKKQKLLERCKYWPACKSSNNCQYHHPTVPCKTFPKCKFGDKCLYIHPNCKFDSLCSRKDCPFTHCSKRVLHAKIPPATKPVKTQSVVCKYYPKCTAKSCLFIHPKPCRFGVQCRAPKCPFGHFKIPNRNQLKWKAPELSDTKV